MSLCPDQEEVKTHLPAIERLLRRHDYADLYYATFFWVESVWWGGLGDEAMGRRDRAMSDNRRIVGFDGVVIDDQESSHRPFRSGLLLSAILGQGGLAGAETVPLSNDSKPLPPEAALASMKSAAGLPGGTGRG